jgi:GTP-binding protein EngB required for normal cell division
MDRHSLEQQIQSIRALLKETYSSMANFRAALLPIPDTTFATAGRLLEQEQYDVVVCGEVKKGKSSFINALMGEEVLPTNTQVATSQICRIINSDQEEYNLVFTDGTRVLISKAELSKYGSQVDADMYGEPIFKDHQLDYIEVKHPIPALPKSVALVDTPGIGAVYAAHEQITRNYLNKAAAVIFIIDPKNPIVAQEKAFIESALKVTKRIMFVMTKMDDYDEGIIQTMISRDQEILAPLANQTATGDITILPVSNPNLFKATNEGSNLQFKKSKFEPVRDALLTMIYNTVGFDINATIYNALNRYNTNVMQTLDELQKSASRPAAAKELIEQKQQKQQQFAKEWGPNGTKINEINEQVKLQLRGLENSIRSLFSQTHPIYKGMVDEIEAISKKEEAEQLSRNMGRRMADAYGKAWKDIVEQCETEIEKALVDCSLSMDDLETDTKVKLDKFSKKQRTFADSLVSGRNVYLTGVTAFGLTSLAFTIVALPAVGAILGAILGISAAVIVKKDSDIKQWRAQLKEHLGKCYLQIHDDFLIKPVSGNLTRLQAVEEKIQHFTADALQKLVQLRKDNLDKQISLLEERAQADATRRKELAAESTQALLQWKPIYENLCKAKELLTNIAKVSN